MSQTGFAFPQSLTEKYRPQTIDSFVGLDKIKNAMRKLAEHPYESAWLFSGPSGTGKTSMGFALGAAMQAEIHHFPAGKCTVEELERVRRICQYVPMMGFRCHLIIIDELDKASNAAQMRLLSYTDGTDAPPNTVLVGTTNDTSQLEGRFLSRWRPLEFSSYGIASDATALLQRIWNQETGTTAGPNFARLVKNSNNNVRAALMALETEMMTA